MYGALRPGRGGQPGHAGGDAERGAAALSLGLFPLEPAPALAAPRLLTGAAGCYILFRRAEHGIFSKRRRTECPGPAVQSALPSIPAGRRVLFDSAAHFARIGAF